MPTIENANIKQLITYEITRMNEYTGKNDTSVHNAVDSLINSCNQDLMYENVLGQEGEANGGSK